MTHRKYTRREALKLASFGLGSSALLASGFPSPSIGQEGGVLSKINIAHVGIARQGAFSLECCSGENQVALCDVDKSYLVEYFSREFQEPLGGRGVKL